MEKYITLDHVVKNENIDRKGNHFTVFYLFSTEKENNIYTAYSNTPGLNFTETNMFLKLYYKENNVNGKTYKNCTKIEGVVKEEYEKFTQTNNVFTTCNRPAYIENIIQQVEEESKDILDKRLSELSKDEETKALKLILAELIKGINKINKTLDNLVVSNTISKTLTPTPLKKDIIREPVDTTPCVTSSETLSYGLPF